MPTMSTKTESDKVGDNIERDEIARRNAQAAGRKCPKRDCNLETLKIFHTTRIHFSLADASIIKASGWRAMVWERAAFTWIFMRCMRSRT